MDIHSTFETLAEAWVAASTPTAVNPEPKSIKTSTSTPATQAPTLSSDQGRGSSGVGGGGGMLPKEAQQHGDKGGSKDNGGENDHHPAADNDDSRRLLSTGQNPGSGSISNPVPLTPRPPPSLYTSAPLLPPQRDPTLTSTPTLMTLTSLTSSRGSVSGMKAPSPRKADTSQSGIASMPIRCVVEHVNGAVNFDSAGSAPCEVTAVEQDAFAILPITTPLCDLVRAALAKLGYSATDAVNAKGAVQLKNWKPLSFDVITDDKEATIDDILRELKEYTLRIRLSRETEVNEEGWGENSVRCAVLSLLKHHSQSALAKLSPLSQSTLSTIANGRYKNRLSLEKCREFGMWYTSYLQETDYSMIGCSLPPDSRMTFHPDHELPLLRSWYREHPSPSHDKFIIFAHELNQGHVRQDRPKITPQKIKIWWKNERQREKRHQAMTASSGIAITATSSTSTQEEQDAGSHRTSGPRTRKRPRSASQGSRPRGEGCEVRDEEDTLMIEPDSADTAVRAVASQAWVPKTDRGSQSSGSAGEEASSFLTSLAPPTPDRRPTLKPGRKSIPSTETFSSMSQGQGHMLSPGPSSAAWQSSFLAWSSQRRSPELREMTMSPSDTGLLLPWQHHRLSVLPTQRAGTSRSESERDSTPSAHGTFGSMERYRYSQTHDLSFTPSSSTSMDFSNIL